MAKFKVPINISAAQLHPSYLPSVAGITDPADADRLHREFLAFCNEAPNIAAYDTWTAAWDAFSTPERAASYDRPAALHNLQAGPAAKE